MEMDSADMQTSGPTTGTARSSELDTERCPECRRPHRLQTYRYTQPVLCPACEERYRRRRWWELCTGEDLIERCAQVGVGQQFCRHGRPPGYEDAGLRERIAAAPMPKGGLLIVGPVGSHKTHLACARTIDAAMRGWTAQMVNWSRLGLEVRASYASKKQSELEVIDSYASLDYLALDDFGVCRGRRETAAAAKLAYDLLDARYARKKITDITTNLTPAEINERFDARVGRRIAELTSVYVMLLPEEDGQDA